MLNRMFQQLNEEAVLLFLQICYGIIYGMGAKSLGEQMGIDENDAACYIETFKSRYTGTFQASSATNYMIRVYHSRLYFPQRHTGVSSRHCEELQ